MNLIFKSRVSLLIVLTLSLSVMLYCPQRTFNDDLSEARLQIALIEEEGLATSAGEEFQIAKKDLLDSHELYANGKESEAREKIVSSIKHSIEIRKNLLPKKLDELSKDIDTIQDKFEASAPAKKTTEEETDKSSDKNSIEEYATKGDDYRNKGEDKIASSKDAGEEEKFIASRQALELFHFAFLSYKDALNEGDRINKIMVASALQLGELLKASKADIERAKKYGATPNELKKSQTLYAEAEKFYKKNDYTNTTSKVQELRVELTALLATVEARYAKELLEKAKAGVEKLDKKYAGVGDEVATENQNLQDGDKQSTQSKVEENIKNQLLAAKEAVSASSKFLDEANYKDSIRESEAALRLIAVVSEQSDLFAKGKKTIVTSDGNGLIEDIGNGWKRYTVRDRKPADCLWCIASNPQIYGNGLLWGRIHAANQKRIKNPGRIYPRQVLLIPPQKGEIGKIPEDALYQNKSKAEGSEVNTIESEPVAPSESKVDEGSNTQGESEGSENSNEGATKTDAEATISPNQDSSTPEKNDSNKEEDATSQEIPQEGAKESPEKEEENVKEENKSKPDSMLRSKKSWFFALNTSKGIFGIGHLKKEIDNDNNDDDDDDISLDADDADDDFDTDEGEID